MGIPSAALVNTPFNNGTAYIAGQLITDAGTLAALLAPGSIYMDFLTPINLTTNTNPALSVGVTFAVAGQPVALSGVALNYTPLALDYSLDGGTTFSPVVGFSFNGGLWTGYGPTYGGAQAGGLLVQDHTTNSIVSPACSFVVTNPPFSMVLEAVSIGTVTTLPYGNSATATANLSAGGSLTLSFGIPKGQQGGGVGGGTITLADGSQFATLGSGLSAGSLVLNANFGTVTGSVGDGGVLSAVSVLATGALPASGGTMTGPVAFSGTGTISAANGLFLQPTNQLWLGNPSGAGAVYSSTIGTTTTNPGTLATNKLWNDGGVVCLSTGTATLPQPVFAPATVPAQVFTDVIGSSSIFSRNGGVVPTPPATQSGMKIGDKWKIAGVYNFAEVWSPSSFYDCWTTLQNFLLYVQLMRIAQAGVGLDSSSERDFVDVVLPAGNYYVSQPIIVPDGVRFGGPGRILPCPYVGALSGGSLVNGIFNGSVNAQTNYTPLVVVTPRAHLSDLNLDVNFNNSYLNKTSGVCFGKNWQAQPGTSLTIGSPGSGYSVGDLWVSVNPSVSPYVGFVAQVTAVNGSGGITGASIYGSNAGAFALPPATYNSGPNLQTQQWTVANGFTVTLNQNTTPIVGQPVFDPSNPTCLQQAAAFRSDFSTASPGVGATMAPTWQQDFATGKGQYQTGATLTNGSQAGRIQVTGYVPDNYDSGGVYGPTFNVMLSGLEMEIDSIQGLGGHTALWTRYAQDTRIGRLNSVESNIGAWMFGSGSIECPNVVFDTCGCVAVIDQSHGIRLHGRAFYEEGNINNTNAQQINSQGAAFLIGSASSAQYPVSCIDLKFTVINMGGLPQSTINALKLSGAGIAANQQAASAQLSYLVGSVIDLTVSNFSQYGASGGSPYPNPSLLPTSGIYQIGYGVDPGVDLRGSLDTIPTIDSVAPPANIIINSSAGSGQGIRQGINVWDGLHGRRLTTGNIVSRISLTGYSGDSPLGATGTVLTFRPPASTSYTFASLAAALELDVGIAPASGNQTLTAMNGASSVGSIVIPSGSTTPTIVGSTSFTVASTSRFTIAGPGTADGTMARLGSTISGWY